jgi:hypothetical protein
MSKDLREHVEDFMAAVGREHFPEKPILLGYMLETSHGTAVNVNEDPVDVKARLEGRPAHERKLFMVRGVVRERTRDLVSIDGEGNEVADTVDVYDVIGVTENLQDVLGKLEGRRVYVSVWVAD